MIKDYMGVVILGVPGSSLNVKKKKKKKNFLGIKAAHSE